MALFQIVLRGIQWRRNISDTNVNEVSPTVDKKCTEFVKTKKKDRQKNVMTVTGT